MTSFHGLSILTVLTIVLASATYFASRGFVDSRLLIGISLIYAAAIWLRQYFYRDETTFFDADYDGLQREKEQLIVFGTEIEDLAEESRERQVLMDLVDFGGEKYKVYLAWIASVVLAVVLQTRFHAVTVVDIAAPILILSSIYFSPFLSQMLIPLALSLFLALFAISRSDSWLVAIYFALFLLSFSLSLLLLREVTPDRLNKERKTRLISLLKTASTVSALFFVFYFLFDFIVPEENPFRSRSTVSVPKPKSKFSVDRLARKAAEEAVKFQEPGGTEGPPASGSDGQPATPHVGTKRGGKTNSGEQNATANGNGDVTGSGSGQGSEHGSGEGSAVAGDGAPADGSSKTGGDTASGRSSAVPTAAASKQGGDTSQVANSDQDDIWQKLPEEKTAGPEKEKSGGDSRVNKVDSELEKPTHAAETTPTSSSGSGRGGDRGGGKKAGIGGGEAEGLPGAKNSTVAAAANPKAVEAAREKKIEEVKRKIEMPLEIGKGILFLIATGIFLPILFRLISRWNKKPEDEIKRQQLSQRQKKKLQSILHQIRARGLSSDAEVIETYNAVLSVFEMGHHPRDEWLPAEDFSMKIGETIPSLKSPFGEATIRFSRTLYGRKSVAPEELQKFRQEVEKILRFF